MPEARTEDYPRLGRYQVINNIAAGGMAEVFLAKAIGAMGFQRLVALKLIHSNFTRDDEFVKMFIDEARIAMHLHHRNIVQVFDLDQVGDTYFIAMEFVHGINLYDLYERIASKNRWIEPPMALYLIAEVSKGLHFAHTRTGPDGKPLGIIHRDISPQNVMLSFEGEVKITDFGIATAAERLHQTAAGIVKGKYAYMAPERLQEQPIDARVDVFAIGVLMYELLVGENPFAGPSAVETIENVLNKRIPPPSERGAPVSKRLDEICLRALARDPNERYPSGQALADAVTEYAMELTHARKDMAAGDSALAALLAELFPEKVSSPPRAAEPGSLDLPGLDGVEVETVGGNGRGDFMETQEDLPAEVVSAAVDEDSGDYDAPTVLRMVAPDLSAGQPVIAQDNSGVVTLPPDHSNNADTDAWDQTSGDATVPTELPPAYGAADATVKAEPEDDDAYAMTIQSGSGIATLPDDISDPAVVPVQPPDSYSQHAPSGPHVAPHKSENLVFPVGSGDVSGPVQRPGGSRLNVIAGSLLGVAALVVAAAWFVVRGPEETFVHIKSTPPGAEVWIDGKQSPSATPFDVPFEIGKEVSVEVRKKGFEPITRRINPTEGMTNLSVELKEITGSLTIVRDPPDAQVIVDGTLHVGEQIELTGLKLNQEQEIVIQKVGFKPVKTRLTLTLEEKSQTIRTGLSTDRRVRARDLVEPQRRYVTIRNEDKAKIYLDDRLLCAEQVCYKLMPIGEAKLEVRKGSEKSVVEAKVDGGATDVPEIKL